MGPTGGEVGQSLDLSTILSASLLELWCSLPWQGEDSYVVNDAYLCNLFMLKTKILAPRSLATN